METETEPKVYTYEDFCKMSREGLFGFFMMAKLDNIPIHCKDPNVYASILIGFERNGTNAVASWLGRQKINK